MRPQSVKELSVEAKQYNYSNNIPLKLWVRTLTLLLANSNSYLHQKYYDESYKLLIRFCEIMLNKLNTHPEVKSFKNSTVPQQKDVYKEYHALYKNLPAVFEEIDKLKVLIDNRYEAYMARQKELEQLRKLQEEKYLQQRKLYANEADYLLSSPLSLFNSRRLSKEEIEEDDRFFQQLRNSNGPDHNRQFPINGKQSDLPEYPELPTRSSSASPDKSSSFQYTFPNTVAAPDLPTKIKIPGQQEPDIRLLPSLPAKVTPEAAISATPMRLAQDGIEHKSVNFTEAGVPLRSIFVSMNLKQEFLKISLRNTAKKLETCGILAGKLSRNAFFITHLLIPEQNSTANTCETLEEENLFFTVDKLDLFILGWIHTHPTQSCFLSSVDLHTQNSYQIMLNELILIVLSPDPRFHDQDFGCFRLTDPPGLPTISKCNRTGFHPHEESNLYVTCNRVNNDVKMGHVILKDHLPFEVIDLRKKKSRRPSMKQ